MQVGSLQPGMLEGANHKKDDPKRLHDAAQQFESLMIAQMLKSVRESREDSLGSGDSSNTSVLGMADEAFAKALGESGGLGLAHMVEASVARPESSAGLPDLHPHKE